MSDDYDPFDDGWDDETPDDDNNSIFNDETPDDYDDFTRAILDELGIDDFDGFLLDFDSIDAEDIRGVFFQSFEEAIFYLYDAGIIDFFGVVWLEDQEAYGIAVDYEE